MNIDIFIPARLASTRLSKKHLRKIGGKPLIIHLINRLKKSKKVRKIIVCTTDKRSDDPLVKILENEKISYFRGSEKDILTRFLNASKHFGTDVIIDVEGDKIYTDPFFVDLIAEKMQMSDYDWVSGNISETKFSSEKGFPHGVVPPGIRVTALKKVCELKKTHDTETGYKEFFTSNSLFNRKYLFPDSNLKYPENLRLTLDYKEDLELAQEIFSELGPYFDFQDILKLIERRPELLKITEPAVERWKKFYKKNVTDYSI